MCTKNGESYIKEQLDSIKNQTYKNIDLFISDDGSDDNTVSMVREFMSENMDFSITLLDGPRKGFGLNFFYTLHGLKKYNYKYFAFADQDDVWEENKIETAIKYIDKNTDRSCLYCSRTTYIDSFGKKIGMSPKFLKKPSFQNALVQSIAGGNTMVFNNHAFKVLQKININKTIVSHDWLAYIFVTAYDGLIIYDKDPKILYRQHKGNEIGSNNGLLQILKRLSNLMRGDYKKWINHNINHLNTKELGEEKNKVLNKLKIIGSSNFLDRLYGYKTSKVYRQTYIGSLALLIAVIFKRLI
jgi:glycosyltransferase involved in cell wall biosynthesis